MEVPPIHSGKTPAGEPLVRVNGWSIKISAITQLVGLIVALSGVFGAWYNISGQQIMLHYQLDQLSQRVEVSTTQLAGTIEANRHERMSAIQDLQKKAEQDSIAQGRLDEQVKNLELLVHDLRQAILGGRR